MEILSFDKWHQFIIVFHTYGWNEKLAHQMTYARQKAGYTMIKELAMWFSDQKVKQHPQRMFTEMHYESRDIAHMPAFTVVSTNWVSLVSMPLWSIFISPIKYHTALHTGVSLCPSWCLLFLSLIITKVIFLKQESENVTTQPKIYI